MQNLYAPAERRENLFNPSKNPRALRVRAYEEKRFVKVYERGCVRKSSRVELR
jgi:hypothetical protein